MISSGVVVGSVGRAVGDDDLVAVGCGAIVGVDGVVVGVFAGFDVAAGIGVGVGVDVGNAGLVVVVGAGADALVLVD